MSFYAFQGTKVIVLKHLFYFCLHAQSIFHFIVSLLTFKCATILRYSKEIPEKIGWVQLRILIPLPLNTYTEVSIVSFIFADKYEYVCNRNIHPLQSKRYLTRRVGYKRDSNG